MQDCFIICISVFDWLRYLVTSEIKLTGKKQKNGFKNGKIQVPREKKIYKYVKGICLSVTPQIFN